MRRIRVAVSDTFVDLEALRRQTRNFFETTMNAPTAYSHGADVLARMQSVGIFEPDTLTKVSGTRNPRKSDYERAVANGVLAATALCHTLSSTAVQAYNVSGKTPVLPLILQDSRLLGGLSCFDAHRELDTAETFDRSAFLNFAQDRSNLGLLVRIADLAETHMDVNSLEHLRAMAEGIPHQHGDLFYKFLGANSFDELVIRLRRAAWAGKWVYAPLAEALGYPKLAGDLFDHYFDAFHTSLKASLRRFKESSRFADLLIRTQAFVHNTINNVVVRTLAAHGIEVECHLREVKHDGKLIGKAERLIRHAYTRSPSFTQGTVSRTFAPLDRSGFDTEAQYQFSQEFEQHLADAAPTFKWESLHDWVALQVVIKKVRGKPLDEFLVGAGGSALVTDPQYRAELVTLLDKIGKYVSQSIQLALLLENHRTVQTSFDIYNKPNGYLAVQHDFFTDADINLIDLLPFEIQLHGSTIYSWLNQGGAAHFLYLGGETDIAAAARTSIENGALAALRTGRFGNTTNPPGNGKH